MGHVSFREGHFLIMISIDSLSWIHLDRWLIHVNTPWGEKTNNDFFCSLPSWDLQGR